MDCGRAARPRRAAGDRDRRCRDRRHPRRRRLGRRPVRDAGLAARRAAAALRRGRRRRTVHGCSPSTSRPVPSSGSKAVPSGTLTRRCRPTAARSSTSATRRMATICSRCRWRGARWTPRGLDAARRSRRRRSSTTVTAAAPYRPWNTLAPRFWTPTLGTDSGETFAGAAVAGSDALGRHGYVAAVSWSSRGAAGLAACLRLRSLVADPVRLGGRRHRSVPQRRGAIDGAECRRPAALAAGASGAERRSVGCTCRPTPSAATPATSRSTRASSGARCGPATRFTSARTYGYSISREEGWA